MLLCISILERERGKKNCYSKKISSKMLGLVVLEFKKPNPLWIENATISNQISELSSTWETLQQR